MPEGVPVTEELAQEFWAGVEAARQDVAEHGWDQAANCLCPDNPHFQAGYAAYLSSTMLQEAGRWAQRATETCH